MALPGAPVQQEITGKIRVGEKKEGSRFPNSVDYFRSDAPEFALCDVGDKPTSLAIRLANDDPELAFATGLEWWTRTQKGANLLACYTKDSGTDPIALRYSKFVDPENVLRGEIRGQDKQPITCAFRECRRFKDKLCKPMGRLDFRIISAPQYLWRLDTKSWNTIENLEKFLAAPSPRPLSDRELTLSVQMTQKGDKRFPVLSLTEVDLQINTDADVTKGDALIQLSLRINQNREGLAAYLDQTHPGWMQNEKLIGRIKEIGVDAAIKKLLEAM